MPVHTTTPATVTWRLFLLLLHASFDSFSFSARNREVSCHGMGRWAMESGGVEDPAPYLRALKWHSSRHGDRIGKGDEACVSGDPRCSSMWWESQLTVQAADLASLASKCKKMNKHASKILKVCLDHFVFYIFVFLEENFQYLKY